MDNLREHGFYGGGLVDVDKPELVRRYNNCLTSLGLPNTSLTQFKIDGRGWSPEIATERNLVNYLSHGGAVQFAVILTPEQIGKPVHHPFFSFERGLLEEILRRNERAVSRVTKDAGMTLQLDPGMSEWRKLGDVTAMHKVCVTQTDTLGIIAEAQNQQGLVKRFKEEHGAWSNDTLRRDLIESGKRFGDLRFNPSIKNPYYHTKLDHFYVSSFGGVFVIRIGEDKKTLLVISGEKKKRKVSGGKIVNFDDKSLLPTLIDAGLVEIPLDWYRENLQTAAASGLNSALSEIREAMLVASVYKDGGNDIDFLSLSEAQRKRLVIDYRKELPPEFIGLERLEQKLARGDEINPSRLTLRLRSFLARPNRAIQDMDTIEVVSKLLCRVAPSLVTTWYYYDKETFYARYAEWPLARKTWAVKKLLTSGLKPRRQT